LSHTRQPSISRECYMFYVLLQVWQKRTLQSQLFQTFSDVVLPPRFSPFLRHSWKVELPKSDLRSASARHGYRGFFLSFSWTLHYVRYLDVRLKSWLYNSQHLLSSWQAPGPCWPGALTSGSHAIITDEIVFQPVYRLSMICWMIYTHWFCNIGWVILYRWFLDLSDLWWPLKQPSIELFM
jgi:hypothetical protein